MQIQQANGPVRSVGAAGQSGSFSIAMNGKAFRVLSDTMYQDKIGSIMREISCNALDSHIMAGTPEKPFTLHLPDAFEPWVSFRDYGVGLSPDSVQNVFCVYFQSTKDQSNDAVGAFGLGAKTPFSYTDQFNVTSIHDGKKYMYSAFINGEGIPEIQLMAEIATDEPNGVEIKIGVEPKDFAAFINAAKTQLRYFPVKPEVTNYRNGETFPFETDSGKILYKSDNVKIYNATAYGRAKMHIVQGPVGYPLDVAQISPHLDAESAAFLRTMNDIGADLYFNIGEIGVTASREGVEYKGITIDSLKTRIREAHDDVVKWIESEIQQLPTVYEKALFVNGNREFATLINAVALDLSPAKKNYSGSYYFAMSELDAFMTTVKYEDMSGNTQTKTVNGVTITKYSRNGLNGFSSSRNNTDSATIIPMDGCKTVVVVRDDTKTPIAKMRHYFKEHDVHTMYAISAKYDTIEFNDEFVSKLTDALGGFTNIVRVSEMDAPPRDASTPTGRNYSRPTAYKAMASSDMESVANWTRVYDKLDKLTDDDGDAVERALYIEVDRQRTQSYQSPVKAWYKELRRADVVDLPLYAVRSSDVAKLANSDIEWIKLEDYVTEKRAAIMADKDIKRYTLAGEIADTIQNHLGCRFDELTGLNKRSALARLLRIRDRAYKLRAKADINIHLLRIAAYDAAGHPARTVVKNATQQVFAKTPMVLYVARSGYGSISGDDATHVVDYINMCYNKA